MPRKWHLHWRLPEGRNEAERDSLINTLGNLTLLTGRLNSKVSNGPWLGKGGKREGLEAHDVLLLNREILKGSVDQWTDEAIRLRTKELAKIVCQIWPVPLGHRSGFSPDRIRVRKKVDLSDLIVGGVLVPGMSLYPRLKKYAHRIATLLPDGRVEVDAQQFTGPTDAASAIAGKRTSGWWFFLVDQASRRSLRDARRDYIDAMAVEIEDDDQDDDSDDDDV